MIRKKKNPMYPSWEDGGPTPQDNDIVDILNNVAVNTQKQSQTMAKNGKKVGSRSYGGKMPPAYENGGFVNGNMFTNDFPNYISDYNGINGIPPKVYEYGGQAPSDAIPVQGPFPYQTYGTEEGYGQIPPPKVYASGGIIPTSNSFAGSPFPQGYRWETYPSYLSEYPGGGGPTSYLGEAAYGISIGPGDPVAPVGDSTLSKKTNSLRAGDLALQEQARIKYIQDISKKYGIPTNQIYSKSARRYLAPRGQDIDNKYIDYEFQDSTGKWQTLRQNFDDKNVGYPVGAYNPTREDGGYVGYAESGIHINPANRGKFNATKKKTGKTTEELTHSKNPITRKRAIFAQNAAKWNHADNGGGPYGNILPIYNPMNIDTGLQNTPSSVQDYMSGPDQNRAPGTGFKNVMKGIGSAIGGALGGMTFNTAGPIMGLGALSNAFTRGQEAVSESATQTRRNVTQGPIYNPYKYGDGSSALYANGGTITDDNSIQQAIMTLRNAGYDVQMD